MAQSTRSALEAKEKEPSIPVIAVMGPTGTGKSTFVTVATGDKTAKIGHGLDSETQSISLHRLEIDGETIMLMDTPGFDDTYRSDTEILQEIAAWLADVYVKQTYHLVGIIYMHRLMDARMSGSLQKNYRLFRHLVGQHALSSVILVANTFSNMMEPVMEKRRFEDLRNIFWNHMIKKGSTAELFNGTSEEARDIVRTVLNRRRIVVLEIQEELVDQKLELPQTGAGKVLRQEIEEMKEQHRVEIEALQSNVANARTQDADRIKKLQKEQEKLHRELRDFQSQSVTLESHNSRMDEVERAHRNEMQRMEASLADRISFLEEQNSAPPPAYSEAEGVVRNQPDETTNHQTQMIVQDIPMLLFLYVTIRDICKKLLRPRVCLGYTRLEWTCSCGEKLYGDFREPGPGGIGELAERLKSSYGDRAGQQAQPQVQVLAKRSFGAGYNMPRGNAGGNGSNSNMNNSGGTGGSVPTSGPSGSGSGSGSSGGGAGNNNPNPSGNQPGQSTSGAANTNIGQQKSLQLCVATGKFSLELSDIVVTQLKSDGAVFQQIREEWQRKRYSILPMSLRLKKPGRIAFVKFKLGRRPFVSLQAGTYDKPSIPPMFEVVPAKRYLYAPCPITTPPMDSRTFLHHFYASAAQHPDIMWAPRLPWKLGRDLSAMEDGWGIEFEEQPSWVLISVVMCFVLILSGLVAGFYCWKTGDNQSGIAIGTWITAVQTMGLAALFFRWT